MSSSNLQTASFKDESIAIVGGGLVGCLAACYFARRNYQVTLYEFRSDIRKASVNEIVGKSINMAISARGRAALAQIGAEERITSQGIEMYSRMLHDMKGARSVVPYGKKSQCILSIDRRYLNELLLNEAEKYPNVKIVFNHKLFSCNTSTGDLTFDNSETKESVSVKHDLIIGCDGAYSQCRRSLLREKTVEYSQTYMCGYYIEMDIQANKQGEAVLPFNHLHIWPRGHFMLIALPNNDNTFTCTLFMPFNMFEMLKTRSQVLEFFEKYFADTVDLFGRDNLVEVYFAAKPSPLISIKCDPHHGEKCVLLGDSAHAMVPFFGQGMNCGFEDCTVFFELFDKYGFENLASVLSKYSEKRVPDAHAICDLAIKNYEEMRYLVTTRGYKIRKQIDGILNKIFPNSWIPLYTMVTFTRIRYSEVVKKRENQDKIIKHVGCLSLSALFSAVAAAALFKLWKLHKVY